MFNRRIVQKALRHSLTLDNNQRLNLKNPAKGQDSVISLLIHDIFGGEILKTRWKKGWHFYNRIDGERIVFFRSLTANKYLNNDSLEDIPSSPEETYSYISKEDYLNFFMKFVRAFEEVVGLNRYKPGISA